MEKTIDNSFIEEREILIRVFLVVIVGGTEWRKRNIHVASHFLFLCLLSCKWTFMSDEYQISLCSGKLVQ